MMDKAERERIETKAKKLIKKGKTGEAVIEYKKLLTGSEQDIPIRNIIGDLLVKSDQKEKAVQEFEQIADLYEDKGIYSKSIATLKRISRIDPDNLKISKRLADLYNSRGFKSEALVEYFKLAKELKKNKKNKQAIQMYEAVLKLNADDMDARETLAELYEKEDKVDEAIEELNEVAEHKISKEELKDAYKMLERAKKLKAGYPRTLTNIIEIYKKEDKRKEAFKLIHEILKKDPKNLKGLYILGNLHLEEEETDKAKEVFLRIVSESPKDINARVKLGKMYIQEGDLDKAFEYYGPIVDFLTKKKKEDKAIGLLGLILSERKPHLKTLEKLASLYRSKGNKDNLEIVNRLILKVCRSQNLKEKKMSVLGELLNLFPENEEYFNEYKRTKKELGLLEEEEDASLSMNEIEETVDKTLAKVDLYREQGLIKNAKRILQNLNIKYPDHEKITKKIKEVEQVASEAQAGDIASRLGEVKKKETELFGEMKQPPSPTEPSSLEPDSGEKLTAADVFAETDIIPMASPDEGQKRYYDLSNRPDEEIEAIKDIYNYQLRGDTTIVEKALSDIVSDFRKALNEKVGDEDYDNHYNLAVAFMEQGLFDEAIEEAKVASKDKKTAPDSFLVISTCLFQKGDFKEALKWLKKALELTKEGTESAFSVKYEMGLAYEKLGDWKKALEIYKEVKQWDKDYRDVTGKIKKIKKKT
ncbi:MAG: tetratricopeptide repeat protein [Candidatus Aminicenantes bacterium]|nr:tetratricopeptide repeat protein [Candidatus Aminicenantes bacterium]